MQSVYKQNCISCKLDDQDEKNRTFYEDDLCKAVLRTDNQCWLGRFIIIPKLHLDPLDFWIHPISEHVMRVYTKCAKMLIEILGATCVQMAQLGSLTLDQNNNPTYDQRYQHTHIHGIPRYAITPVFRDKEYPDPQFINGKFSALNLDPNAGLPKVVPTLEDIVLLVDLFKSRLKDT